MEPETWAQAREAGQVETHSRLREGQGGPGRAQERGTRLRWGLLTSQFCRE